MEHWGRRGPERYEKVERPVAPSEAYEPDSGSWRLERRAGSGKMRRQGPKPEAHLVRGHIQV